MKIQKNKMPFEYSVKFFASNKINKKTDEEKNMRKENITAVHTFC